MGKTKGPYKAEFPEGSMVQIADRAFLENFLEMWKLHDPLKPDQLNYADKRAEVTSVGFYFVKQPESTRVAGATRGSGGRSRTC